MRPKRMQFGRWILPAISTAPPRTGHPGSSPKFQVPLISSRWVLGTGTIVTHMRYGDSILPPRSIVTTIARASSTSSPVSFATYTWAAETYGGHNAARMSFASIFRLVFLTKSLIHLGPFRSLRLARMGTYGRQTPAILLFTSTMTAPKDS